MPEFEILSSASTPYLYVSRSCSMAPEDISAAMGDAFQTVFGHMMKNGIAPAGPAISVYHGYDPERMSFRAGLVVDEGALAKAEGEVQADTTPATDCAHFLHKGPYAKLRDSYGEMMGWLEAENRTLSAPTWELYLNDPSQVGEEELLTEVWCALVCPT